MRSFSCVGPPKWRNRLMMVRLLHSRYSPSSSLIFFRSTSLRSEKTLRISRPKWDISADLNLVVLISNRFLSELNLQNSKFKLYIYNVSMKEFASNLPWQSVPGTGYELEELRYRIQEIDDLRDEKEQHGLAEVAQDGNNSERHARKVAERVAHKNLCRISVGTNRFM